jgi:hypothetical protein
LNVRNYDKTAGESQYYWILAYEINSIKMCLFCIEERTRRIFSIYEKKYYYSRNDKLIGVFIHVVKNIYSAMGNPYVKVMDYVYENDFGLSRSFENVRWNEEYRYTNEELSRITDIYANEPRRGDKALYWEDVTVN